MSLHSRGPCGHRNPARDPRGATRWPRRAGIVHSQPVLRSGFLSGKPTQRLVVLGTFAATELSLGPTSGAADFSQALSYTPDAAFKLGCQPVVLRRSRAGTDGLLEVGRCRSRPEEAAAGRHAHVKGRLASPVRSPTRGRFQGTAGVRRKAEERRVSAAADTQSPILSGSAQPLSFFVFQHRLFSASGRW